MTATSEWMTDFIEAERQADMLAGDNPGLIVRIVEVWTSDSRYEDNDEGDLYLVSAATEEEFDAEAHTLAPIIEYQYDATRPKEEL